MITRLLIDFWTSFITQMMGFLPASDPPAWVTDAKPMLGQIWAWGDGLGAWIPWSTVAIVFPFILGSFAVAFVIKCIRIVASFLTLGGGSAS